MSVVSLVYHLVRQYRKRRVWPEDKEEKDEKDGDDRKEKGEMIHGDNNYSMANLDTKTHEVGKPDKSVLMFDLDELEDIRTTVVNLDGRKAARRTRRRNK